MLQLLDVVTHYGSVRILNLINLEVRQGEIVVLLGGNASGKSTTILTILGVVKPTEGSILFRGEAITGLPTEQIICRGIAIVPEARRIFSRLTVQENLALGAYSRTDDRAEIEADFEMVYTVIQDAGTIRLRYEGHFDGRDTIEGTYKQAGYSSKPFAWIRR